MPPLLAFPVRAPVPTPSFPVITTGSFPNATVGVAYSLQLSASSGTPPYTWSIVSASPNSGSWLSLSSSGLLTGTPGTAELELLTIQVTDANGRTGSSPFQLLVVTSGGGGGANIVWTAPFSGSVIGGGDAVNGSKLVITRSSGAFAAKSFGLGAPQLFDTVDKQYVNGVNQGVYAGFADGADIVHLIYSKQSKDFGTTDVMKYYTSRSKRTSFDIANYATVGGASNMKGCLGLPRWPAAFGTQNNQTLFVSFWCRSRLPYSSSGSGGAGDETNKYLRISDTTYNSTIQGSFDMWARGIQQYTSHRNSAESSFAGMAGYANTWVRIEMWVDLPNGITNHWIQQKFLILSHSGTGNFECCKPADILYVGSVPADVYLDPTSLPEPAINAICAGLFGYDDGHGFSAGNDFDIAQVYVDPNYQRPELYDQTTWDQSPTTTMNREVQGLWTRDSATQITVTLGQGQFASLPSLRLGYVNSRKTVEEMCRFT